MGKDSPKHRPQNGGVDKAQVFSYKTTVGLERLAGFFYGRQKYMVIEASTCSDFIMRHIIQEISMKTE